MIAPLSGHNLVRLIYLDEAGTSHDAPALCVAGVLVHGDKQSLLIEQKIDEIVKRYIPVADQLGFIFHATDIFHGSNYFDRRKSKWNTRKKRWPILVDLASVINSLRLPVVAGFYEKDRFGVGVLTDADLRPNYKHKLMQVAAAMDCAIWADRWLDMFSPSENGMVVAEDTPHAKRLMKKAIHILRSEERMRLYGMDDSAIAEIGLPLKRIIDSVHFTEKAYCRALQLADLCAFTFGRMLKLKEVPEEIVRSLWSGLSWTSQSKFIKRRSREPTDARGPKK